VGVDEGDDELGEVVAGVAGMWLWRCNGGGGREVAWATGSALSGVDFKVVERPELGDGEGGRYVGCVGCG
jgi:hypothetical protein